MKLLNSLPDHTIPDLERTCALITGVGGFLGRRLAGYLVKAGATVNGVDLPERCAGLASGVVYHQVDLLNLDRLATLLHRLPARPNAELVVFHLAGQSHVGKCREEPARAVALNVTATMHLLEACRRTEARRVVFPSTALVYALPAPMVLDEVSPVWPKSVYAATKLAAEALLKGYATDFGFACRIARLGNVYGAGGAADSVVSAVLRQVQSGGPICLKTLAPVRDFIYRDDVVRGLIALATHSREPGCQVFNLASGTATSIRELVQAACRVQSVAPDVTETGSGPSDSEDRLLLSIQRLSRYADWHPVWTLEEGLQQTLAEMALEQHD